MQSNRTVNKRKALTDTTNITLQNEEKFENEGTEKCDKFDESHCARGGCPKTS